MAEETLVIKIDADTTGLIPTIDALEKLGKIDAATAAQFKKANADIQAQEKALKGVSTSASKAGKDVEKAGKDISGAAKQGAKDLNDLNSAFKNLAGALGIGLTIGALKEFVSSSITAFDEQEVALQRLRSTLEDVAGEGGNAFATLKSGAEELQRTSIFSDEQIEGVQNMLVTLGLTSQQTEVLTKRIVDTASKTGRGLEEITNSFILAIEGQTRGLRTLGSAFTATGDQVQDFNLLLESTAKFAGGAGQALETQAGQAAQLKNQINELEEAIGQASAPIRLFFLETAKNILELFAPAADKAKEGADKIRAATAAAFKDIPIAEIETNISALKKLSQELLDAFVPGETSDAEAKASRDKIIAIDAQVAALEELIAIKKQSAKDDADFGKADREVKEKSIAQLRLEIELLGKRSDANTINVKAAISAREEQIKKVEELNKKAEKDAIEQEKKLLEIRKQFAKDVDDINKAQAEAQKARNKEVELSTIDSLGQISPVQKAINKLIDDEERLKKQTEDIINNLVSLAQTVGDIFSNISEQRIQDLEELRNAQQENFDSEQDALKEKLDRDLITQAQFENQSKALKKERVAEEKRIDQEIKKIKQEQAARDKAFSIFETIINTARAISQALPNPILTALVAALGAAQLAKIISTPIPKFHKGKLAELNSSEQHAIIRRDETVVSPENSRQYRETLTAIHNRQIAPSLLNSFARMNIGKMPGGKDGRTSFPNIDVERGMKQALRKGVSIKNTNELGRAIANNLPKENIYHRI